MGVCLLELLNGHPPHHTSSLKCLFLAGTVGIYDQIPSSATAEASLFLRKCLEVDQTKRGTSKSLLQDPWVTRPGLSNGIDKILKDIFFVSNLETIGI